MKALFHTVGFALVMFLGAAFGSANAANSLDTTYVFPGATVVFMATPCGDAEVRRNLQAYEHDLSNFFNATIYFEEEPNTAVNACYELGNGEVDIHWGADSYAVVPMGIGTEI